MKLFKYLSIHASILLFGLTALQAIQTKSKILSSYNQFIDGESYFDRSDFDEFEDIISYLSKKRSSNAVYIKLLRKSAGLLVNGETLPALPQSVISLYTDNRKFTRMDSIFEETVWEERIELPSVFVGSESIQINVK